MRFRHKTDKTPSSWKRRIFIYIDVLLVALLLAGLAGLGYGKWRWSQVKKISDLGGVLRDRGETAPGSPMNVLLVGSDDRSDLTPAEQQQFGTPSEVGPIHSDTIMVMRIDPIAQRAAILSLPRDLWVDVYSADGKNLGKDKINAAIQGGPQQLIKTIYTDFNIPIDHYLQVDFKGFRDIVGSVGGVAVRFDAPARDKMSGLDVKDAGCQVLSGDQALAYVRSRHYESYESGRWRGSALSDLSRIDRQQDFIRRVMRKAISKGGHNPLTLNSLIDAGVKSLQIDQGFSASDIARVARRFQSLDPNQVEMMTLPNTISSVRSSGQMLSILNVKQPDASQTIDRFLNGPRKPTTDMPVPIVSPGSISVRVLNGSGVSGQASDTVAALKDAGFVISGAGDSRSFAATNTSIHYASGQKDKGDTLARFVKGNVVETEDPTLRGVDIVITTGSSFGGIADPKAAPTPDTTTTAAAATKPEPSAAPDQSACA